MSWMMFWLIVIGMLLLYKIVEQITYTICWLKSNKETRAKFLEENIKNVPSNKVSNRNKEVK